MNKIYIILILFFFTSCGFKPIYKLSSDNLNARTYYVEIVQGGSRETIDEISSLFVSPINADYKVSLYIAENLSPLIINTNGTVAKYRIEVVIKYILISINSGEAVSESIVRGFAQYDVGSSEINNEETKASMIKSATNNAIQIMISKIQTSISQLDDN